MYRKKLGSIPYLKENFIPTKGHYILSKQDGENTSIYSDGYFHLRSIDSRRPSKDGRAKPWSILISPILESEDYHRMIFENIYDQHSIHYSVAAGNALQSYYQCLFLTFMYEEVEMVTPYQEQVRFCALYGIGMPPVLAVANGRDKLSTYINRLDLNKQEGLVVRSPDTFPLEDIHHYVGKWVRPGHVQTDEDWISQSLPPNQVLYTSDNLLEYGFHNQ